MFTKSALVIHCFFSKGSWGGLYLPSFHGRQGLHAPKCSCCTFPLENAHIGTRSPHPSTQALPSAFWQTLTGKMQLENGSFQLALAHTVSRLGLLNIHQNSTASSGGRKTQENPEAAASLVAVTVLMKAHPQRKSARQAIQRFWKDSHSSFPPWSCSMLQKAQNTQRLSPSQGSLKCQDYTASAWLLYLLQLSEHTSSPASRQESSLPAHLLVLCWLQPTGKAAARRTCPSVWREHQGNAAAVHPPAPAERFAFQRVGGSGRLRNARVVTEQVCCPFKCWAVINSSRVSELWGICLQFIWAILGSSQIPEKRAASLVHVLLLLY